MASSKIIRKVYDCNNEQIDQEVLRNNPDRRAAQPSSKQASRIALALSLMRAVRTQVVERRSEPSPSGLIRVTKVVETVPIPLDPDPNNFRLDVEYPCTTINFIHDKTYRPGRLAAFTGRTKLENQKPLSEIAFWLTRLGNCPGGELWQPREPEAMQEDINLTEPSLVISVVGEECILGGNGRDPSVSFERYARQAANSLQALGVEINLSSPSNIPEPTAA